MPVDNKLDCVRKQTEKASMSHSQHTCSRPPKNKSTHSKKGKKRAKSTSEESSATSETNSDEDATHTKKRKCRRKAKCSHCQEKLDIEEVAWPAQVASKPEMVEEVALSSRCSSVMGFGVERCKDIMNDAMTRGDEVHQTRH